MVAGIGISPKPKTDLRVASLASGDNRMERKLRDAGYVKLAKPWEKRRAQAVEYHTK